MDPLCSAMPIDTSAFKKLREIQSSVTKLGSIEALNDSSIVKDIKEIVKVSDQILSSLNLSNSSVVGTLLPATGIIKFIDKTMRFNKLVFSGQSKIFVFDEKLGKLISQENEIFVFDPEKGELIPQEGSEIGANFNLELQCELSYQVFRNVKLASPLHKDKFKLLCEALKARNVVTEITPKVFSTRNSETENKTKNCNPNGNSSVDNLSSEIEKKAKYANPTSLEGRIRDAFETLKKYDAKIKAYKEADPKVKLQSTVQYMVECSQLSQIIQLFMIGISEEILKENPMDEIVNKGKVSKNEMTLVVIAEDLNDLDNKYKLSIA